MEETADSELLARLRRGEVKAYETMMRRHNRLLFRAARGIVMDDAEAQDVVQEAYLRAFTALHAFRGQSTLATWLVRITINQALQQQRKLGRLVVWDGDGAMEDGEMPPGTGCDAEPPESPEALAARNQLRRQLEDAVDLLPPLYRSVFILRAVEGLSVEETAQALRVSGDVVKTRYLRARGQLRAALGAGSQDVLPQVHEFLGQRCDDTVRQVLSGLRSAGIIRDH